MQKAGQPRRSDKGDAQEGKDDFIGARGGEVFKEALKHKKVRPSRRRSA
ncbi:MAG: hypothetical protein AVDCRST_MAG86-159 [uncultured Truepera sp.]|uniref:Uncharacterized protein n=1 Tax=uncultured Truepera sp. TaxID=543023 RepID=A0A6J4ULY9_9DEIN|nr:MAG: hypothetical protein AVDCRST_MAG86-159 [uncultured Truepera sp.]